jgi:hypothetical protein
MCDSLDHDVITVPLSQGMPPKKAKGKDEDADLGLPAEGAPAIRGPEDAIQRLKERTLLDRVSTLYVALTRHSFAPPACLALPANPSLSSTALHACLLRHPVQ